MSLHGHAATCFAQTALDSPSIQLAPRLEGILKPCPPRACHRTPPHPRRPPKIDRINLKSCGLLQMHAAHGGSVHEAKGVLQASTAKRNLRNLTSRAQILQYSRQPDWPSSPRQQVAGSLKPPGPREFAGASQQTTFKPCSCFPVIAHSTTPTLMLNILVTATILHVGVAISWRPK